MNRISWTQIVAFVAIVAVTFLIGIMLLPLVLGWYGGSWAMGPGMMGGQTQGGWCPVCGGTGRFAGWSSAGLWGWFWMLGTMLFPVGLLVLLILGAVWLVRSISRPTSGVPAAPGECPECGKRVAADWRHCPECGRPLDGDG
ncbi:MAG TPA: zinc ribbon domain-containing protein [Anaerolineae bacterium]|nr:zinc ribbon domain-containing protein [Anaerolineae bacterium]